MLEKMRMRARRLKSETFALYLAARDPRTPWYAKLLVAGIVAYALSPIDLIPDFVPVLGYLDDLILVPLGIALAIRLIPANVLADCRERSNEANQKGKPVSRTAAAVIVLIWLAVASIFVVWVYKMYLISHAQPVGIQTNEHTIVPMTGDGIIHRIYDTLRRIYDALLNR
jgi:uncharacterized membrane protein YkvA (DUF1232 family)